MMVINEKFILIVLLSLAKLCFLCCSFIFRERERALLYAFPHSPDSSPFSAHSVIGFSIFVLLHNTRVCHGLTMIQLLLRKLHKSTLSRDRLAFVGLAPELESLKRLSSTPQKCTLQDARALSVLPHMGKLSTARLTAKIINILMLTSLCDCIYRGDTGVTGSNRNSLNR